MTNRSTPTQRFTDAMHRLAQGLDDAHPAITVHDPTPEQRETAAELGEALSSAARPRSTTTRKDTP